MELTQVGIRTDNVQREEYETLVVSARDRMGGLGRGARSQCATDLYLNPAQVSNVLNFRLRSVSILDKIRGWLDRQIIVQEA